MRHAVVGVVWVVRIVVVGLVAASGPATAAPRVDDELEARFRADVERASPDAALAYDQGNAARLVGAGEAALAAYQRAIELAPGVDHPRRRACGVLLRLDRVDEGIAACEAALAIAPDSPYDLTGLAQALTYRPGGLARATGLARQAVDKLPASDTALATWCTTLAMAPVPDEIALKSCIARLLAADPDGVIGNYLGATAAGASGDFALARARLERARAGGLDEAAYRGLSDALAAAENDGILSGLPFSAATFLWVAAWVGGAWLAALVLLLAAGYILSRLTLAAVGTVTAADAGATEGTARERRLRGLYRKVLLACGLYFYLSVPILLGIVILAGGGAIYFFFAIGHIPIKLVFLLGVVVFFTVAAIVRSLVIRARPGPLGHKVDLAAHPRLSAMLAEIGDAVGTRPADAAYLTPGTEMAVSESGGVWAAVRGKRSERSLIMGVGLFDGMTQIQLRSILAHEHGHYRNQDTAGGGFALAVRRSLMTMIIRLAESGVAGAYNPAWWFLRGFHRVYLIISQGASRLQEVLADRWAIQAYGSAGFIAGYRHVVTRSVEFDHQLGATLKEVIEGNRPLPNLYQYRAASDATAGGDLATAIEAAMTQAPTVYDSHPAPSQRIAWAEALAVERSPEPGDAEPIWALFDGRDELERLMTAEVRSNVLANHGVEIPEAGDTAGDATAP